MATLKDIAAACHVSVSAVCTAINHPQKISRKVREKILNKAREFNYFVDRALKVQKVLLVFNNYKNHYYNEYYTDVIFGITQRLSELKVDSLILPDFGIDYAEIYDYSGIIFVGRTPDAFLERAVKYKMPHVLAVNPNANYPTPAVYQDSANGLTQLIEYVKNSGHENVALFTGETDKKDVVWNEFYKVVSAAFAPKNITLYQADYSMIQSVEIAFAKFLRDKKKTLILCSSDLLAYYVYRAARKYAVRIPKDVSVTGFDGISFPRFIDEPQPQLTTVGADRAAVGAQTVDLLLRLLRGEKVDLLNYLPMQIRIGDSVRRIG
ncbi:transcriptional regulators LacI family [Candidatus Termititenax persephonae]|uniref:Transcriptional regulators LacI family n=1 Tax=Candidatus Termititenax persephonae TaxID=2218525 RepID=A0A388TI91_9BACT|nr:transcriptional regulators LacI family [Candidatus Termititenax persephonae]